MIVVPDTRLVRLVRLLSLAMSLTLTASCSSAPALLRGSINADATTNPDARGRPSPVVVRVYELQGLAAFNSADFFSLFEREGETLGADLVGREEFEVSPAETRPYQRQLQPGTRFMGVVAAFRDLENSRWRQAVPVPAKGSATVTIGVQARAVTVAVK
jgi:type VI secretion system protein VasD